MLQSDHLACFRPPGRGQGPVAIHAGLLRSRSGQEQRQGARRLWLIEQYGDASGPDLLRELTGCPKWQSRCLVPAFAGAGSV
jgi:hypothetical protein